jgi:mannose-6-phosphate isomerase-like protein (cupin superfamily)
MEKKMQHEERPWGTFNVLHEEDSFKLKKITVYPGHKLSLQSHSKRNEVWTIIEGTGIVTLDDIVQDIERGDVIIIPSEIKHRIENTGKDFLVFVEVQHGESFEESDIVRYEDSYGRAGPLN